MHNQDDDNDSYKLLATKLRDIADRIDSGCLSTQDQSFVDKLLAPSDPSDDEVMSYLFLGWFIYKLMGRK